MRTNTAHTFNTEDPRDGRKPGGFADVTKALREYMRKRGQLQGFRGSKKQLIRTSASKATAN